MGILDFFGKRKKSNSANQVKGEGCYTVYIPEEKLAGAEMQIDGKPYVGIFNSAILELTPKEPFSWFLSLILGYDHTEGEGMPCGEDVEKMQNFIDGLSERLKDDKDHPNAVFLGRVTGAGATEAMWYVNNPEKANAYLQHIISSGDYPFEFKFRMEPDKDWTEAHYWLQGF